MPTLLHGLRPPRSLGGFAPRVPRAGATRLDILAIIALAVFGAAFLAMLLVQHRENALRAQCQNNLRQIGLAIRAHHDASAVDESRKLLPPSRIAAGYATWAVLIAPHLVKEHPLLQWDEQQSYFAQKPEAREAPLRVYFCPAWPRNDTLSTSGDTDQADTLFVGALGDYASVAGDGDPGHDWTSASANGALIVAEVIERKDGRVLKWRSRTSLASLTRGDSYTFLIGEKYVPADHFGDSAFGDGSLYNGTHPASFSRVAGPGFPLARSITDPFNTNFGSYHNGICNFLMADTSVRPMSIDTSEDVLGQLARRGD